MQLRKLIIDRLDKLKTVLDTPGVLRARLSGCRGLDLITMLFRLKAMGINPKTILDIGAYRGIFSRCAHYTFPDAAIYAFEPLTDCFKELSTLKKKIRKFECYNVALGEKRGETSIHRSSFDGASSLLEMASVHKQAFPSSADEQLETVRIEMLDTVLDKKALVAPVLMKLDVQGYEKFVLQGAEKTIEQTDFIVCEMSFVPLYEGQALFDEMYRQISDAGFRFSGQLAELQHPETTEVLQIDGLFIRDHERSNRGIFD